MEEEKRKFRLPRNVRPTKYDILIRPNFNDFTFSGHVLVHLSVKNRTKLIVMNSADLEVHAAHIAQGNTFQMASDIMHDKENETITFKFADALKPGKASIDMLFKGTLNDKLCGFYRSKYTMPDGTARHMATTQFEDTDARRAFPCFDEPEYKATFDLTLVVPEDRTAISNMPISSEASLDLETKIIRFKTTPVMSTYLLAFVVGDLESIDGHTKNGTLIRVFATPGKKEQGIFALDVGIKALEYFEDYFGISYPLPKMDMVAVPDFEPGAMENWGLVTFREVALLFDPKRSSNFAKQRVAGVIAHEFAHQWFGNLVTMKWWNDLWLNESFATFMGNKAVAYLFPEWKIWDQFYATDTAEGLSLDGLTSSHPIEAEIDDPHKIGQIFDAISYSKGASVLRMLEDYLGEETFQKGVCRHLLAHQYGNAETKDLWAALSAKSGQDVASIMGRWTKKSGYPVVKAERVDHRDNICAVRLSQKQFLYHGRPDTARQKLWKVPINILTAENKRYSDILDRPLKVMELMRTQTSVPWIKLNASQAGFFRVQYSPEMQEALFRAVETGELPALDRIGLANDAYALQRAGMIPATQYLDLAQYYRDEIEYSVWAELSTGLSGVINLLKDEPYYENLLEFERDFLAMISPKMGWDPKPNEDELAPMLRALILQHAGYYGDKEAIEEARQRFALLCLNPESINPDIRAAVCNLSARYGGEATYEALLKLYTNAATKEEQMDYLRALGCFRDKGLLSRTLEFAFSTEVRLENAGFVIISVATNAAGRNLAWEFVKNNWEEIKEKFAHSMFMFSRVVEGVVSGFTTHATKKDVEEFFAKHPTPQVDMALRQALERIDMNIAWLERNRDEVERWITDKK